MAGMGGRYSRGFISPSASLSLLLWPPASYRPFPLPIFFVCPSCRSLPTRRMVFTCPMPSKPSFTAYLYLTSHFPFSLTCPMGSPPPPYRSTSVPYCQTNPLPVPCLIFPRLSPAPHHPPSIIPHLSYLDHTAYLSLAPCRRTIHDVQANVKHTATVRFDNQPPANLRLNAVRLLTFHV